MKVKSKSVVICLVAGLLFYSLRLTSVADSCYSGGTSSPCSSPGSDPTPPSGDGWSCTTFNTPTVSGYKSDDSGFYLAQHGCNKCTSCTKEGEMPYNNCGSAGGSQQNFLGRGCPDQAWRRSATAWVVIKLGLSVTIKHAILQALIVWFNFVCTTNSCSASTDL